MCFVNDNVHLKNNVNTFTSVYQTIYKKNSRTLFSTHNIKKVRIQFVCVHVCIYRILATRHLHTELDHYQCQQIAHLLCMYTCAF